MTATEASSPTTNTASLPSMPCATPLHACACLSFVQPFYLFSSHFVWPSLSFFCNFSAQLRTERALMRKRKRNMPLHWRRQKGGWKGEGMLLCELCTLVCCSGSFLLSTLIIISIMCASRMTIYQRDLCHAPFLCCQLLDLCWQPN